ncbi:hypothetical protein SY91_02136 [Burkholderia cenocepacia]|uniref:hypothetical protein n=1 Tax=Burkholderia cenocepacia TaxID=95486 RepID=UPI0003C47BC8|nr:hypothetical protein [Burkholderia cenocepacia]ESS41347.1 hypothetical protein P355_5108 [Burkholderia cenocepacia KC-01]QND94726.1 hypothetical protein SY91_02136 [Burkholderia cenocepacia]
MKEPILSQEEAEAIFEATPKCIDGTFNFIGYAAALESALLEKLCGEPIYQTRWSSPYTVWGDVPKGVHDDYQSHGYADRRIVYELKEKHHG